LAISLGHNRIANLYMVSWVIFSSHDYLVWEYSTLPHANYTNILFLGGLAFLFVAADYYELRLYRLYILAMVTDEC
jgi:prepilin-type processing-associated H-X9-DG protein